MIKSIAAYSYAALLCVAAAACGDDPLPKPKAYLRLDYPEAKYSLYESSNCPYSFAVNTLSQTKDKGTCNITIEYPKMKATIYINYKPITARNLDSLLRDAQNLTYKHVIKADGIQEQRYINPLKRVYGMFYQVGGNAATNAQFYVTDSTRHFLTGSVYFYAKPNFDSIMPAASYIKNDMQNIMETLNWK
uniref:gliding motility lipoprotein GldD n=1 Tax=Flavobacterium cyanobacteriorum TaxID=2022802 RepID=UPI0013FD7BB1|nr:gliding motility lipoprotein GldD [Flavobacterium cyanobacteriorum]